MATKVNRIAITTDQEMKDKLEAIAEQNNTSLSKVVTNMIDFALDIQEDMYFEEAVTERMKNHTPSDFVSGDEIWK